MYWLAVDVIYSLKVFMISLGSVSSCSQSLMISGWVLYHVDRDLEVMPTTAWDCWFFFDSALVE